MIRFVNMDFVFPVSLDVLKITFSLTSAWIADYDNSATVAYTSIISDFTSIVRNKEIHLYGLEWFILVTFVPNSQLNI